MRERRTIEGKWWIHGDDKAAHFGTLVFDPETGLELTVKIPQSRSDAERFRTMHDPASVPTAIHGKDQHGHDVTAFEPFHFMHDVGSGLETYQIGGISAAIQNMLIASTALGYGACWVEGDALPREEEFKALLFVPKGKRLLALVPVGVPEEWPEVEKRPLESVLHWQVY